jgi:hypothetical protein
LQEKFDQISINIPFFSGFDTHPEELNFPEENFKQTLSPNVRKISGILKNKKVNYKEDVSNYLSKKYLNNE